MEEITTGNEYLVNIAQMAYALWKVGLRVDVIDDGDEKSMLIKTGAYDIGLRMSKDNEHWVIDETGKCRMIGSMSNRGEFAVPHGERWTNDYNILALEIKKEIWRRIEYGGW